MSTEPTSSRRTLTEPEPWLGLDERQRSLVRLQHSNPEPWWWCFDGNLAVCVAPPLEPYQAYYR